MPSVPQFPIYTFPSSVTTLYTTFCEPRWQFVNVQENLLSSLSSRTKVLFFFILDDVFIEVGQDAGFPGAERVVELGDSGHNPTLLECRHDVSQARGDGVVAGFETTVNHVQDLIRVRVLAPDVEEVEERVRTANSGDCLHESQEVVFDAVPLAETVNVCESVGAVRLLEGLFRFFRPVVVHSVEHFADLTGVGGEFFVERHLYHAADVGFLGRATEPGDHIGDGGDGHAEVLCDSADCTAEFVAHTCVAFDDVRGGMNLRGVDIVELDEPLGLLEGVELSRCRVDHYGHVDNAPLGIVVEDFEFDRTVKGLTAGVAFEKDVTSVVFLIGVNGEVKPPVSLNAFEKFLHSFLALTDGERREVLVVLVVSRGDCTVVVVPDKAAVHFLAMKGNVGIFCHKLKL